jgi:hypothetical protein
MKGTKSIWNAVCVTAMTFTLVTATLVSAAHATAVRTFVSGIGNDSFTSSNCPRTNPCRTLGQAYTVTQSGGEIIALDPAGYGPITITGPLSILGAEGTVVAPATGTTGITITAGATDKIILRNIQITGSGQRIRRAFS